MLHRRALFFLSFGSFSFGSSVSILQEFVASKLRHCCFFHYHALRCFALWAPGSPLWSILLCLQSLTWLDTMETNIPRTQNPQGSRHRWHSCLCCYQIQKPVMTGSPVDQCYRSSRVILARE